jgi:hypothetical protein
MNRTTLALLIAPMWIPVGMEFYMTRGHSFGDARILSVLYGFFGYLVSLSFSGSIVDFLRARGWTKLWQFSLAGVLLALLVCLFVIALGLARWWTTWEAAKATTVRDMVFFSPLMLSGALMGATIWLIAEWRGKSETWRG